MNRQDILKKILEFCETKGLRKIRLEEIGIENPEGIITLEALKSFGRLSEAGPEGINYFAHSSQSDVLRDLQGIYPECSLDFLARIGYLQKRSEGEVPLWEDILKQSMDACKRKYKSSKIKKLNERYNLK